MSMLGSYLMIYHESPHMQDRAPACSLPKSERLYRYVLKRVTTLDQAKHYLDLQRVETVIQMVLDDPRLDFKASQSGLQAVCLAEEEEE